MIQKHELQSPRSVGSYLYDFREYAVALLTSTDLPLLFTIALPAMLKFQFALSAI